MIIMERNEAVIAEELAQKFKDAAVIAACEQCGSCSGACPLTGKNDFNIRRIIRHIQLDLVPEVADSPLPWFCTTCGRCEDACPNSVDILAGIRALRQLSPPERVPEWPPCTLACPAKVDVPGYLRLIAQGKVDEAYALILEKVPFPGVLGRVCTHPCEDACRREEVNMPIAICVLKRYAADNETGSWRERLRVKDDTGHKIAIIGAGPAGLTAAFYLRIKGHRVTIFESRSEPGGMMRFGIPAYRLPQAILEKEINQILELGIELKTGQKLGEDFDLNQLKSQGYEAVFLAVGAQLSRKIELEGANLEDVLWGLDFLSGVREGKEVSLKDRVLVVGGGNVAIDVALTALRFGAKEVTLACLETGEEMPANRWEVEQAINEGVKLMPSWGPSRVLGTDGKVSGIELVRCTSVFDAEGNFSPTFDDNTKAKVEVEQVILSIGQTTDLSFVDPEGLLKLERGLIVVDQDTQETGMPGVFAGGDVTKLPGIVIEAIATGRRAASSIDRFLGGDGNIEETLWQRPAPEPYTGKRDKGFADQGRVEMPKIPVSETHHSFAEVELGLDAEQATREAKRCLQCDLELIIGRKSSPGD
jgi:NADPH-dependent glutamate synthase beta subunit-like oxidoreductase